MSPKKSSRTTDPPAMTDDARAALERSGFSRRRFLRGSGALIVGFSVARLTAGLETTPDAIAAQRFDGTGNSALDAWIAVADDGSVTAYTGKCEFGQGLYTAQTQLVAEELGVALDRVKLVQCDTARCPDQGTTSGSQSHPTNFNQGNLALAAATARSALMDLASARFGVPVTELTVRNGVVGDETTLRRRPRTVR